MRLHCYAMQIMEKTITLEPLWSGKWEVPSDALREALSLLYDD